MKQFLIIGNGNAITCKEIFPLIKENKVWYGVTMYGCQQSVFVVPDFVSDTNTKMRLCDGEMKRSTTISTVAWFTNVEHRRRNKPIDLVFTYTPDYYPKYDNYDAIEVSKVSEIPCDYDGVMVVPISFIGKYCPSQFEIVGITENADYLKDLYIEGFEKYDRGYVNGKRMYFRILIRPNSPEAQ